MNNNRQIHRFTLTLVPQSPYLVHGSDPGRFGLDATLLRDQNNCPILPGTLIAGRIAEIWVNHGADLGFPSTNEWFGRPGNDSRHRARLQVADLRLQTIAMGSQPPVHWENYAQPLLHTRIALDDASGSVQRGAMLVVEQIAQAGAKLCFVGEWRAWTTPEEARKLAPQLRAALLAQTQIGADRGVGLGVVLDADVKAAVCAEPVNATAKLLPKGSRVRLVLSFDEPFCITERVHNGNLFKGGDVVPGGAILGALASTLCSAYGASSVVALREQSYLARHFDSIRCTHAYPTTQNSVKRPVPIPYSWVKVNRTLQDAWRHKNPPKGLKESPAFLLDWKARDFDDAHRHTGWAPVPGHLRVRTAMQDGHALDQGLFAIESRFSPRNVPLHWLADLWLPDDLSSNEQDRLLQEINQLTQVGLGPIGKTDAVAHVRWENSSDTALASKVTTELRPGELIALRLNSPALLLDAVSLADQPIHVAPKAYAEAFDSLFTQVGAAEALIFSHHFARERLVGGDAMLHRYLLGRNDAGAGTYRPMLLTEAGSVFVFSVKRPTDVPIMLQKWEQTGLPIPPAVALRYGSTWQDHPYIPNNGYGEITSHTSNSVSELSIPTVQQAKP